ncbi:MAG: cyclic lactone autoinducer peptide [Lachnospiraceae bacterium]|nr:cyclic lactone autoinducer peptide [Lachnospiraceae bacterium]
MKQLKKEKINHTVLPDTIAKFALAFSKIGANSKCCCFYHQPEKPDLKKLRKF